MNHIASAAGLLDGNLILHSNSLQANVDKAKAAVKRHEDTVKHLQTALDAIKLEGNTGKAKQTSAGVEQKLVAAQETLAASRKRAADAETSVAKREARLQARATSAEAARQAAAAKEASKADIQAERERRATEAVTARRYPIDDQELIQVCCMRYTVPSYVAPNLGEAAVVYTYDE